MFKILIQRPTTAHMQFMRYFLVGGTSAVVDLAIFTYLVHYWDMQYLLAAFFGYMVGLAWNHIISIYWVFESKHSRWKEVMMVFLIALGGLLWTELILYVLVEFAHVDAVFAKIVSQGLVLFWNFGMRKFYVFH